MLKKLSLRHIWLLGLALITSGCGLVKEPLPVVQLHALPICYNYGCADVQTIDVSASRWQAIQALFTSVGNGEQERLAIRQAIAEFEQEAELFTPVANDLPRNRAGASVNGRQDCIDETHNTLHFLVLLQQHGLLKFHQVDGRVVRYMTLIDQHFAVRIEELPTGARYVVDSWHRHNGEPAYIQAYSRWMLKQRFSKALNPG